jgi:Tol biopolymer transport system component
LRRDRANVIIDVNKSWSEQKLRQLPDVGNGERFGAWDWSPDGSKIAGSFSGGEPYVGYFSVETQRFEKITASGGYPMWLSDSTRFIYVSEGKAYLTDIKTKRVRKILDLGQEEIGGLGISSDGQLIYFTVASSESDIWLLDLRNEE